jgi:methionine-rich copper-binding protein CopC
MIFLLGLLAGFALLPEAARGHDGGLWLANPYPGSTVAAVPREVMVLLPEAVDPRTFALRVRDAQRAIVDAGDARLDPADPEQRTLVVSLLPDLPAGDYVVAWSVRLTGDRHILTASFTFTATSPSAPLVAAATPPIAEAAPQVQRAAWLAPSLTALGSVLTVALLCWQRLRLRS